MVPSLVGTARHAGTCQFNRALRRVLVAFCAAAGAFTLLDMTVLAGRLGPVVAVDSPSSPRAARALPLPPSSASVPSAAPASTPEAEEEGPGVGALRAFDRNDPDFSNHPSSPVRPISALRWTKRPPGDPSVGVTAIVAHFNTPPHEFEDSLRSLDRQTYPLTRVLVMDDASDPPRYERAKSICASFERCEMVRSERRLGICGTRNAMLAMVETGYVALLDSDDMLEHTFVEAAVWLMEARPDVHVVKGDSVGFWDGHLLRQRRGGRRQGRRRERRGVGRRGRRRE